MEKKTFAKMLFNPTLFDSPTFLPPRIIMSMENVPVSIKGRSENSPWQAVHWSEINNRE